MVPTRGRARLLEARAVDVLRDRVLPYAALVTVNAPEAEVLTGLRVTRLDEAHDAALALLELGVRAVLVKGGHLDGRRAVDVLAIASTKHVIELASPRLTMRPTHGGGCVLASLIAGRLAMVGDAYEKAPERALADAVKWAKKVHHRALDQASHVGGELRVLFA